MQYKLSKMSQLGSVLCFRGFWGSLFFVFQNKCLNNEERSQIHTIFFSIEIGIEWDHVHMNVCQSVQMTKTKVINRRQGQWKVVLSFLKLRSICSVAWVYHKTDENNAIKLLLFWIFSRRRQIVFWQNTILIHLFLFTSLVKVWF